MKIIGERLTEEELLQTRGGADWCCYCGFVGGPHENDKFTLNDYDTIDEALAEAWTRCWGTGATCSGGACNGGCGSGAPC